MFRPFRSLFQRNTPSIAILERHAPLVRTVAWSDLGQRETADDCHKHEEDGNGNRELEEGFFKSASGALDRFSAPTERPAEGRALRL